MINRRHFLKNAMLATGALSLSPGIFASPSAKTPHRFIFIHRGNGLFPKVMVPPSLGQKEKDLEGGRKAFQVDLDKHELPDWMSVLEPHKNNLAIVQGLSGKMCTVGHHSWCSALGAYRANEQIASIKWATVDFELAKLFPSPMEHIELAVFPLDGGNPRGSLDGIAKGFSARGEQQPNYAYGSPKIAVEKLFKSVSNDKNDQARYALERKVLEFVSNRQAGVRANLRGIEQRKLSNYNESVEMIRRRNEKIDRMADQIRKHVPKLDAKFLSDKMNTFERQEGHVEVLLSSLISGLTNVAAFTIDELGHHYTGITGIEGEKVNMHDVGHGKSINGVPAEEVRKRCRIQHMKMVNKIVERLKSVPEGSGTMFDNTTIMYFPDGGETHHAHGTEFPFLVLSGSNTKLNINRQYIRLPYYGSQGHKTLGNWWTTYLNAYGNPIKHFGEFDMGLNKFNINQEGPIKQFLS